MCMFNKNVKYKKVNIFFQDDSSSCEERNEDSGENDSDVNIKKFRNYP